MDGSLRSHHRSGLGHGRRRVLGRSFSRVAERRGQRLQGRAQTVWDAGTVNNAGRSACEKLLCLNKSPLVPAIPPPLFNVFFRISLFLSPALSLSEFPIINRDFFFCASVPFGTHRNVPADLFFNDFLRKCNLINQPLCL